MKDFIKDYTGKNPVRFHMPGHKGRIIGELSYEYDITELFFSDNIYNPVENGIIMQLEEKINSVFFDGKTGYNTLISCGGATLLIQTVVMYLKRISGYSGGWHMICDRYSHVSLMNALALCGVKPLWLCNRDTIGEDITDYCAEYPNIIGIFITSPDYYGDMKQISGVADNSIPVAVDNSHGSHLAYYEGGRLHPVLNGCDFSIDSVHKTLPFLTGTAFLHFKSKYNKRELETVLRIFASTSPSYLILQGIINGIEYLERYGTDGHNKLFGKINKFKENTQKYDIIKDREPRDPFRLMISTDEYDTTGKELYDYLALHNIYCEFYDDCNVVAIPSILNKESDFDALETAVLKYLSGMGRVRRTPRKVYPPGVPDAVEGET